MLDSEKQRALEQLRQQLADPDRATPFFDHVREEEKAKVRRRALLLLDQRARSRAEIRERLLKLDFPPELVEEVLTDLQRTGLIDDASFANEWVRQRHQVRGKTRRALDLELQAKGVSPEVRFEALDQISEEDENALATRLAEKKACSLKRKPSDRKEYDTYLRRIVGMLARRGFGEGVAFAVGKQALDRRIADL